MKKVLFYLFLSLLLPGVTGCKNHNDEPDDDDGVVWDIGAAEIFIKILDKDGNNLLDPNMKGNWVGAPMFMVYNNEQYPAKWKQEDLTRQTRYYMAHFEGLVWNGVWTYLPPQNLSLEFGEFQGEANLDIEADFLIEEINTIYKIKYVHTFRWENKKPHVENHIYLNGKEYDGNQVEIILPPRN